MITFLYIIAKTHDYIYVYNSKNTLTFLYIIAKTHDYISVYNSMITFMYVKITFRYIIA